MLMVGRLNKSKLWMLARLVIRDELWRRYLPAIIGFRDCCIVMKPFTAAMAIRLSCRWTGVKDNNGTALPEISTANPSKYELILGRALKSRSTRLFNRLNHPK